MLAARVPGGGTVPDRGTGIGPDLWVRGPREAAVYGPHMEVGTIVLLFVWLVIAELVVTKLVNDPE
jgi:hypothetical protein